MEEDAELESSAASRSGRGGNPPAVASVVRPSGGSFNRSGGTGHEKYSPPWMSPCMAGILLDLARTFHTSENVTISPNRLFCDEVGKGDQERGTTDGIHRWENSRYTAAPNQRARLRWRLLIAADPIRFALEATSRRGLSKFHRLMKLSREFSAAQTVGPSAAAEPPWEMFGPGPGTIPVPCALLLLVSEFGQWRCAAGGGRHAAQVTGSILPSCRSAPTPPQS